MSVATLGVIGDQLMPVKARPSSDDSRYKALARFSAESRWRLLDLITQAGFSGQIPVAEIKRLMAAEGRKIEALMTDLLPLARTYARPPISNYRVGAVALGASGSLYLGANLEIQGQAIGFSVHAEQASLSSAYMHSEPGVASIAVTAAPCGHCRQFMKELSPDGDIRVLMGATPPATLTSLLPMAFGPKDLGLDRGAFPIREIDLRVAAGASDDLTGAALAAARRSWAPYSKAHSGIAIGTRRGGIYKGSYIENAAFNPSLPPLETALVALVLAGEESGDISKAVLVEVTGASITQKSVTEIVLSALVPSAKLQVVTATLGA
ncbi:MAG TPA: cytidine deaminase [Terriglobia bacterium]